MPTPHAVSLACDFARTNVLNPGWQIILMKWPFNLEAPGFPGGFIVIL